MVDTRRGGTSDVQPYQSPAGRLQGLGLSLDAQCSYIGIDWFIQLPIRPTSSQKGVT